MTTFQGFQGQTAERIFCLIFPQVFLGESGKPHSSPGSSCCRALGCQQWWLGWLWPLLPFWLCTLLLRLLNLITFPLPSESLSHRVFLILHQHPYYRFQGSISKLKQNMYSAAKYQHPMVSSLAIGRTYVSRLFSIHSNLKFCTVQVLFQLVLGSLLQSQRVRIISLRRG